MLAFCYRICRFLTFPIIAMKGGARGTRVAGFVFGPSVFPARSTPKKNKQSWRPSIILCFIRHHHLAGLKSGNAGNIDRILRRNHILLDYREFTPRRPRQPQEGGVPLDTAGASRAPVEPAFSPNEEKKENTTHKQNSWDAVMRFKARSLVLNPDSGFIPASDGKKGTLIRV